MRPNLKLIVNQNAISPSNKVKPKLTLVKDNYQPELLKAIQSLAGYIEDENNRKSDWIPVNHKVEFEAKSSSDAKIQIFESKSEFLLRVYFSEDMFYVGGWEIISSFPNNKENKKKIFEQAGRLVAEINLQSLNFNENSVVLIG